MGCHTALWSHWRNKYVFSDRLYVTSPTVRGPSAECSRLEIHAAALKALSPNATEEGPACRRLRVPPCCWGLWGKWTPFRRQWSSRSLCPAYSQSAGSCLPLSLCATDSRPRDGHGSKFIGSDPTKTHIANVPTQPNPRQPTKLFSLRTRSDPPKLINFVTWPDQPTDRLGSCPT